MQLGSQFRSLRSSVQAASVSPRRQVRFHFSGPADLRRAFVASEVLGRPASLREPHV